MGGGETLVVRLAQEWSDEGESVVVLCKQDSHIHNELAPLSATKPNLQIFATARDHDFYYLNCDERATIVEWLNQSTFEQDCKYQFISFTMQEAIWVNYLKQSTAKRIGHTHWLLHPIDHLYHCVTFSGKVRGKIFKTAEYASEYYKSVNNELLNGLNQTGNLIAMNDNTSRRIHADYGIVIPKSRYLTVPYSRPSVVAKKGHSQISNKTSVRAVWVGRLVNFKIPALKCFLSYLEADQRLTLDIIGYGDSKSLQKQIKKSGLTERVKFIPPLHGNDLVNTLANYDIGYAMGTSVIELSLAGLPVIVALASPDFRDFNRPICAGWATEQRYGNYGDNLYHTHNEDESIVTIESAVAKYLEYDPNINFSAGGALEHFGGHNSFERLKEIVLGAPLQNTYVDVRPADISRRLVRRFKNRIMGF